MVVLQGETSGRSKVEPAKGSTQQPVKNTEPAPRPDSFKFEFDPARNLRRRKAANENEFPLWLRTEVIVEKKEPQESNQDEKQLSEQSSGKAKWQSPKLVFVKPKLTKHGELKDVTGFFGPFTP